MESYLVSLQIQTNLLLQRCSCHLLDCFNPFCKKCIKFETRVDPEIPFQYIMTVYKKLPSLIAYLQMPTGAELIYVIFCKGKINEIGTCQVDFIKNFDIF